MINEPLQIHRSHPTANDISCNRTVFFLAKLVQFIHVFTNSAERVKIYAGVETLRLLLDMAFVRIRPVNIQA